MLDKHPVDGGRDDAKSEQAEENTL